MDKPKCVGIIMDGNRRYAKEKGLPSMEGHRLGYKKLHEVVEWAGESDIKYLILYAFSTENWNRKEEEVSYLMDLFRTILKNELQNLKKNGIRIKHIGNVEHFSKDIQELLKNAVEETKDSKGLSLVLALSYGGRDEILNAVKRISFEKTKEEIKNLDEETFSKYLYTGGIPDPDLIIRTSGEMRLSNFLPWQSVYSELFFVKTYWPEFSREDFESVVLEFAKRKRRMGK